MTLQHSININSSSFSIEKTFPEMVDPLSQEHEKSHMLSEFLQVLAMTLAARDIETWEHSLRVTKYAWLLGLRVGLSQKGMKRLHMGALLHDIGKIGIRDEILLKPRALTDIEYDTMKKHPEIGAQILKPIKALHPIIPIIRHHHERYDGNGYPSKLQGEKIPLTARIVSLADAFEAMTSGRLYRKAMTFQSALEEIQNQSGKQFDPYLAKIFGEVIVST